MCGICGQIGFENSAISIENLEVMTSRLSSRRPDDVGLHLHGSTALGHRRLKIIDLSERARQPMEDSRLGLTIVYNGSLYNYDYLRSELISKGYQFFSGGDTEVVLKAYHAWGSDCVKVFNGMFAFAIAHRDSGDLFLARDRLGIKPLYYAKTDKTLRFASSLPALLACGEIDTTIDPVALHYYMTFHLDVPVGVLLSGGLDSSLVVGLLAEQGQKNLNTFSIGFEDVNGEAGNEFEYSDYIAKCPANRN